MKTTLCSLPLLAISILLNSSILHAQLAHVSLYPYLAKLPSMPEFPSTKAIQSESPGHFEDCSDLEAIESTLQSSLKLPHSDGAFKEDAGIVAKPIVAFADEKPEIKRAHDELLAALKEMQSVRTEYQENFVRLESAFAKHADAGKANIIPATRNKLESEEYLFGVYLTRIKPAMKKVDELLEANNFADGAQSAQTKNVFRGAQQFEALVLTDIIERLKLERITISNCARIAQQK